ncbi:MAG: hypothetical protein H0X11_07465 [Betaproteobacteria bacterium]|nr:hypothetical protein [Betaproteobacteria bacterium]
MTALLLYLTLGVTAAVVLVLVVYLIGIIVALWHAKNSLTKLAGGLIAIRDHTLPLGDHVQAINGGLSTLLQQLLAVNTNLAAIVAVAQGKSR